MSPALLAMLQVLISGAATLATQFGKTGADVGTDIQLADQIALAVLQKNAEIKGLTIDWKDPNAVLAFVQSLPPFTPIPAPPAGS